MPDIITSIVFLADIDLYKTTKPYHILLQAQENPNGRLLDNMKWITQDNIKITDIRDQDDEYTIEKTEFEIGYHMSKCLNFETPNTVEEYKGEIEDFHRKRFGAVHVSCYEVRVRLSPPEILIEDTKILL